MAELRRLHFIGVGGAGLSALARLCLWRSYEVSGSDLRRTPLIAQIEALGLSFQVGHEPRLVKEADLVVVSSAVPPDNPEILWARDRGLPVWKRHQFLPWLSQDQRLVAVAGTHGKTTTTALLSHILVEAGLDPTCVVGGVVIGWGGNARLGHGDYFVLEADEYDRTFLALRPWLGAISSVDMDHPDCYGTDEELVEAFRQFADLCRTVVANADDARAMSAARGLAPDRRSTYGTAAGANWRLLMVEGLRDGTRFRFRGPDGSSHEAWVPLWGAHSASNALAAVALAAGCGVSSDDATRAMASFQGVERRFQVVSSYAGITLIDDYGHHPTQIRATLQAARQRFPDGRMVLVLQPHTFSRLSRLFDGFAAALSEADVAFVLPVYGAREGGDSLGAAGALARAAGAELLPPASEAAPIVLPLLRPGDVVLNLNAGDATVLTSSLAQALAEPEGEASPRA